jgi:ribonucleoside-triphosphate reductase
MKIIKRDGRKADFDPSKIEKAILKAFVSVDGELTDYALNKAANIAEYISKISSEKELTIDEIQNLVETGLMSTKRKDVARAYITYRNERTAERNRNSKFMKTISEKLTATNVQNQNANVDEYSFGGRMGEANDALAKQYALDYCVSKMAKNNHLNNEIYIHDLGSYAVGSHNCLSIPFDKLLANGFNTRQTDVRPANSINTAFQLVAVIFQLQSLQQFGGVSATHIDWTMVPYVRKSFYKHFKDGLKYIEENEYALGSEFIAENWSIEDEEYKKHTKVYKYAMDKTIKETYQAVEGMYHNLNTLQSRSGNQLKRMAG